MNNIYRNIFRAIHEGKWLSIEYKNKSEQITKYWIGIEELNAKRRTMRVEGLHLGLYSNTRLDTIFIDSIQSSQIVEGTYFPVNQKLVGDIYLYPEQYRSLFDNAANLRILNYLEDCNRMDVAPYKTDFELVRQLDGESMKDGLYPLSNEQFQDIVRRFQHKTNRKKSNGQRLKMQQLALNVLSLHTPKGLYVLAYRRLELDVKGRCLRPAEDITICNEFTIDGFRQSIRRFLEAEDYELLYNFEVNQEKIKDHLLCSNYPADCIDDMPYIIGLGMDTILDLHKEYGAIMNMYRSEKCSVPIKAFFGDLLRRPYARVNYPLALLDKQVNLDQILAIHNAMKYSIAYIQGPPGTGKTSTIINTISTAFFHEKTVLFTSYNNHPIDGVFEKLSSLEYKNGKKIPFPVVRLGSNDRVKEAIVYIRDLYSRTEHLTVYEKTLDKNKEDRKERAQKLSDLLKRYDEVLDLEERAETLNRLQAYHSRNAMTLPFQVNLEKQARRVESKIDSIGVTEEKQALELLDDDEEEFRKYLYYTSAKYIKKLDKAKYEDLKEVIFLGDLEAAASQLTKYLYRPENVKKFLEVFPIVITTCISAAKIGEPKEYFDMVIVDEASQCNTAMSLVPILRGRSLMLVGDPQQLNPVVLLEQTANLKLKQKYGITDAYDYCKNSIYKTYLSCDSVSDEVLLRSHYRCNKKIIDFNNKKYYHSMLDIKSISPEPEPLVYIDIPGSDTNCKNTAPDEIEQILQYAAVNKDKSIGVITPFVNQKEEIIKRLKEEGLKDVTCGTVHAFQGDEKDVILFSTTISKRTFSGTYDWLKNNKELINVATSRAKHKLVVLADYKELERLHSDQQEDDLYELVNYVKSKGVSKISEKKALSRALGTKPYNSETEEVFLKSLNHAMENIWLEQNKFTVEKDVKISQIFQDENNHDLFYNEEFDFVVYEKRKTDKVPVLAIELDSKNQLEEAANRLKEQQKNMICQKYNIELIRVESSYVRRYNHIKEVLMAFFGKS